MPLEPDHTEPGLWTNPESVAGVHALIIGVSRFDHLSGGSEPAHDTYGLEQLSVSALTAYRFFGWLCNAYSLEGWPVARVRLLLSPQRNGVGSSTADELEGCNDAICAHAPEASFENCKRALENWYADMEVLDAPVAARSLFLYSGHGMERRQHFQLLLPCDYLKPRGHLINNALSTPNIADALSYLKQVKSHILLLDGCRNDIDKLRGATGATILNDEQDKEINPLFEKAVLFATASGLRAYSPKAGGLSLFGQALLDGLLNNPQPPLDEAPLQLVRRGRVAKVEVNRLASYMKGRVAALIRAANESVVQIVRSEIASSEPGQPIELAEIPVPPAGFAGAAPDSSAPSLAASRGEPTGAQASWFLDRYGPTETYKVAPNDPSPAVQIPFLHHVLGSEALTFPWFNSLKVLPLSGTGGSDFRAVRILSSAQSAKSPKLHRVKVTFSLETEDPLGHALWIEDGTGRRSCCVLPTDLEGRIFDLEIDVQQDAFVNFSVQLSAANPGLTGAISVAWEALRAYDPLAASRELGSFAERELGLAFQVGESALRDKLRAPLAATVAALILLKSNEFARMHDWARNLANWFPMIPDGVILWTEQCRRESTRTVDEQLSAWFVQGLSQRCLPFSSDLFGLGLDLLSDVKRRRLEADAATRRQAGILAERFEAASPFLRDTGLFCTYSGFPGTWNARSVLGSPASTPAPKPIAAPRVRKRAAR